VVTWGDGCSFCGLHEAVVLGSSSPSRPVDRPALARISSPQPQQGMSHLSLLFLLFLAILSSSALLSCDFTMRLTRHNPRRMDFTFGGKYRLEEELAIGGCGTLHRFLSLGQALNALPGTVFYGVHTVAGKEVAIKVEPAVAKHSPLKHESKIYKSLMGGPGVPWIIWSGKQGDYNVMVIDLLGPSLEDLFKMCNRHFSLRTVALLADQLVSSCSSYHCADQRA
jgi:hypothetical protein